MSISLSPPKFHIFIHLLELFVLYSMARQIRRRSRSPKMQRPLQRKDVLRMIEETLSEQKRISRCQVRIHCLAQVHQEDANLKLDADMLKHKN